MIRIADAPDQSKYDPNDKQLRTAAQMLNDTLRAPTVQKEEEVQNRLESAPDSYICLVDALKTT